MGLLKRRKGGNYAGMDLATVYSKNHWGIKHIVEKEVDDDDLPEHLIENGRLVEFHYRPTDNYNPKRKDKILKLTKTQSNKSHLAFDPEHPNERLYIVLDPRAMKRMKKEFWDKSDWKSRKLSELAPIIGGRHGTPDYPDVKVKPIGIMTAIVYATEKKGDGYSFYIHKMGEESGIQPAISVDAKGRLWIVAGNYTNPIPGITD